MGPVLHLEADHPVDAVVQLIRSRLGDDAPQAEAFTRQFYSQVALDDLQGRPVQDLYGAALSHWHFARRFSGGAPRLRVYNPRPEEHGWQSTHTVIEIVSEDMPFLVDSITMEVNRQGLTLHLIIHPLMRTRRDTDGTLQAVAADTADEAAGRLESIIHVEVDRRSEAADLDALGAGLTHILADVRAAVGDWPVMRERLAAAIADVRSAPLPIDDAERDEGIAFLEWLAADNFTLLGCREYELANEEGDDVLRVVPGSGAGILRESGKERSLAFAALPPEVRTVAREPHLLIITKANGRSTVHRPGYMDYIGVKRFGPDGSVTGERRFLGLFTSTAYNISPLAIPLLRRKVETVQRLAALRPQSHAGRALLTILEQYPRDELIQSSAAELHATAMGILGLGERQRTRLFMRRDPFGRFICCLIYAPRETYDTGMRQRMQNVLMDTLGGVSSEFNVQLSESALARILIVVHTPPGTVRSFDVRDLELRLVRATRRWEGDLSDALRERCGEERGNFLNARYRNAFPAGYREDYDARSAVGDIELMESLAADGHLAMSLYVPLEAPPGTLRFKVFRDTDPVPLHVSLPLLEHMGVRVLEERPYEIERADGQKVWMHDFGLSVRGADEIDVDRVRGAFQDAFRHILAGDAESDDFNRLVLAVGLTWREVAVLRAYAKYLRQTGFTFSQAYMEQTLAAHPALARQLLELFIARFDPDLGEDRAEHVASLAAALQADLDEVANLDEDRILRQFLAVIQASLRTNWFRRDGGAPRPCLSFKLDPHAIPGLPEPRPLYEIFVYAPRVEGIHLRGGKVARGGLRWSDRMEDFRTEVLGLMKAQMVKNAVIVPVGSKGGFVVKNPPPASDRDAFLKEGVACYHLFLRGLLDLTDNRVGGAVVPPPDVVRHDGDDPYLVVAADKGTATFSDYANGVSAEYGFWLRDAFASGGSAGYDHKKMGITARGAWESGKHHFRALGVDIQTQAFTVVGVGDMSGDVFGNGMLLSRQTRLVAAFDHRHIFIDPMPDPATSFAERERLFALPRSSWADYDARLLSPGGAIVPRSAKSVSLSPEARTALGIEADTLTPQELVRAILVAPVDMLYNGGIGTYVKASSQRHAEVGDRANDAVRVDGRDLRCKVVVEGGNLGFTQLGRIEYARAGGRINTDAIDNSAGVDCSDHEVNIKILLNLVIEDGELTEKQRNALLAGMTDEVALLVLRDNYFQNSILSGIRARGTRMLDEHARYIRHLVARGRLNRDVEFLPPDDEIAARKAACQALTAPELAVLLAYGKMELFDALLASDVPEDPYIRTALHRYFPAPLRERYPQHIERHPLRREIIATHVVNSMVNRVGPSFAYRLSEETGAPLPDVVRAYIATREVFGFVPLWQRIEALDNRVDHGAQIKLVYEGWRLIQRGTLWFLRHREHLRDLAETLARFAGSVDQLAAGLYDLITPAYRDQLDQGMAVYLEQGVPADLVRHVACLDALYAALDIVETGAETGRPVELVARVYFALAGCLDLHRLARRIGTLPTDSHWQGLARNALRDDLSTQARGLATDVLRETPDEADPFRLLEHWKARRAFELERCRQIVAEVLTAPAADLAMLSVALRELRGLAMK